MTTPLSEWDCYHCGSRCGGRLPTGYGSMASMFATDLLSDAGREGFGRDATVSLLPAGSSKRREAFVLLRRGARRGVLSPREAREMALRWLAAAEATESDQLVSEALRATGTDDSGQEKVFGYLRELRAEKPAIR